jgi:hypothetical protein
MIFKEARPSVAGRASKAGQILKIFSLKRLHAQPPLEQSLDFKLSAQFDWGALVRQLCA